MRHSDRKVLGLKFGRFAVDKLLPPDMIDRQKQTIESLFFPELF